MDEPISYRILDTFGMTLGGSFLSLKSAKLRAILAWFCLSGQRQIPRARLADLLWSGSNEEKARASLRNILYMLRDEPLPPGVELLRSDRGMVFATFAPPANELTAALLRWDHGDDTALRALSLAGADLRFAADLFGLDAEFDDFLLQQRERNLTGLADGLRQRMGSAGQDRSRLLAERLRDLAPQDENATRHLMQLDIAGGNPAAALAHYERLWDVLDRDYDVEPSLPTQALAVGIKSQTGPVVGVSPVLAVPVPALPAATDRITVYLRPVASGGMPPETQMAVQGMQAEIIAALLAIGDWVVIEAAADADLPMRRGGFELRGDLSPGLGEMRLILTLKDLSTRQVIWTSPLSINRADWIRNSAMAVQRLAARLTGKVEEHYVAQIDLQDDLALSDYDRLIRARWLMNDWTAPSDRRAEEMMRTVRAGGEVGLRARIGLAELLNSRSLIFPGLGPIRAGVAEALALAEGCVSDAPQRADAWLALAWALLQSGQAGRAAEVAETAAQISQSSPRRMAAAAEVLALAGQTARAMALSKSVSLMDGGVDKVTLGYRVSIALLGADYAGCMDLAQRSNGVIVLGQAYGAAAAVLAGDKDRALAFWQRFSADLHRRWQGDAPPDPLGWFMQATPVQATAGRRRIEAALRQLV